MLEYILFLQFAVLFFGIAYQQYSESEKFPYYIAGFSSIVAIFSIGALWKQISAPQITKKIFFNLFVTEGYNVHIGLLSDSLSVTVICVVAIIAALGNWYSLGYVKKNLATFLCYLNALPLIMTFFIAANGVMQMYISLYLLYFICYFLISFNEKEEARKNGIHFLFAFKTGDAVFLAAVAMLLYNFKTLSFEEINKFPLQNDEQLILFESIAIVITVSIFLRSFPFGVLSCGRNSASIPIPALALTQSSVISVAEIFTIIRLQSIFECSEMIQNTIVVLGLLIALTGALAAVFQQDLKKILVFSSISQSGLMLLACGFSAYGAALMLYITHAFSKALLIFSSGSVIKALSGECRINRMGGLMETLPKTYVAFIIAILTTCAVPLLSSYYAYKTLLNVIISSELDLYYFTIISMILFSLLTNFYLFRVLYKIFYGHAHIDEVSLGYVNEDNHIISRSLYFSVFFAIFSGVIFYYTTYNNNFWKDIFVLVYKSNTLITVTFFAVNFIEIIGAILICRSLRIPRIEWTTQKLLVSIFRSGFLKKMKKQFSEVTDLFSEK